MSLRRKQLPIVLTSATSLVALSLFKLAALQRGELEEKKLFWNLRTWLDSLPSYFVQFGLDWQINWVSCHENTLNKVINHQLLIRTCWERQTKDWPSIYENHPWHLYVSGLPMSPGNSFLMYLVFRRKWRCNLPNRQTSVRHWAE